MGDEALNPLLYEQIKSDQKISQNSATPIKM